MVLNTTKALKSGLKMHLQRLKFKNEILASLDALTDNFSVLLKYFKPYKAAKNMLISKKH